MAIRWANFLVPIPPGWEASSRPNCLILRRECIYGGHEVYLTPVCDSDLPLVVKDAVSSLMKRRVVQGHPEEGISEFCGLPAYEARWSDGIASIRSLFFVYGGRAFEAATVRSLNGATGFEAAEQVHNGIRLLSKTQPAG